MAGVLDLRDVLELVDDSFHDGAFAEQQLIDQRHQPVLHVGLEAGNQLKAKGFQQLLKERLGDVASVSEELAEQPLDQTGHRLAVIDVAGGQGQIEQFALVVDEEMKFEAEEPAHRGLASSRQASEHLVLRDAVRVADGQRRGVQERDTGTCSQTRPQVGAQGQPGRRDELHKARITDQTRKLSPPVDEDVVNVEGLEISVMRLVEPDQDGHDLAQAQASRSVAPGQASRQALALPRRLERTAEIIDSAEQFE